MTVCRLCGPFRMTCSLLLSACLISGSAAGSTAPGATAAAAPFLASVSSAPADSATTVAVLSEDNWDQLAPRGKEVDAIYGDFVLKNELITAVIAQPLESRNANMTVRSVGGALLDLSVHAHQSDQLSAFYPGRRQFPLQGGHEVSSDTSSQTIDGKTTASSVSSVTMTAAGSSTQPQMDVRYSVTSGQPFLTIQSIWTNTTGNEVTLKLEDDLRADGGNEDMVKAPNGTSDLYWFHDIFWQQAYGVTAPGYNIRSNSNARDSVLVYDPADDQPVVIAPGAEFTLTRHVYVARDLPSVLALHDARTGHADSLKSVKLRVADGLGQPVPTARVALSVNGHSRGTTVTDAEGIAVVTLPHGQATPQVTVAGHSFAANSFKVEASSNEVRLTLSEYRPGTARITVTDGEGRPIPAKLEFAGSGNTPAPNWGPESAEHFVRNLAYTPNGQTHPALPAGDYDVTVSHGPEYDAHFLKLTIKPGETTEVSVNLPRVVDTTGWVSADFHSHSSPSGDNTGSQLGRVLNLAAEHIEFAPCTEHNRISSYVPHLQSLQLTDFVATVSGLELTGQPLPLNHQNAFPLIEKPRTQDGGAPTTDGSPETQIERLAAWDNNSEKLIQQNHPDIGWLFYDRNGDQVPDEGYSRSFQHMNVMEIHPIDRILDRNPVDIRNGRAFGNSRTFNWLQLLNQGFRIYGVVNTDSHYNFHGSGGLRLWLKSSTDDPAKIDPEEMKQVARAGHLIMSNGPFLEFTLAETGKPDTAVIAGHDLSAASGQLTAHVKVQCPNWIDVDTVFLLVNGRSRPELTFSRDTHPQMFSSDSTRFDHSVNLAIEGDAHVIAVTGHRTELLGPVQGPNWGAQHPAALSNPVFVDVDGNGFQSSKDTLDHPLPVKFAAN